MSTSLICVKKTNRKHTEMYSSKPRRNQFISNETVQVIGPLSSESKPRKCPLQFARLIFDNTPEIGANCPGCQISQVSCSHIRVDSRGLFSPATALISRLPMLLLLMPTSTLRREISVRMSWWGEGVAVLVVHTFNPRQTEAGRPF